MKMSYWALILTFIACVAGGLVWSANHYHGKFLEEQKRADAAEQRADSTEAITANVLRTMAITNIIQEANQHAKQQIALESQRTQKISKWLLRMMIVLHVLCLLPLLTGCGSTRTVYVQVPVVPLPASLTAETPQPDLPDHFTWGSSLDLNVALLSALAQCNTDKADIRRIEVERGHIMQKK